MKTTQTLPQEINKAFSDERFHKIMAKLASLLSISDITEFSKRSDNFNNLNLTIKVVSNSSIKSNIQTNETESLSNILNDTLEEVFSLIAEYKTTDTKTEDNEILLIEIGSKPYSTSNNTIH